MTRGGTLMDFIPENRIDPAESELPAHGLPDAARCRHTETMSRPRSSSRSWTVTGWCWSAILHLFGVACAATWVSASWSAIRPGHDLAADTIQLQAVLSRPAPPPQLTDMPVIVSPQQALMDRRVYRRTSTRALKADALERQSPEQAARQLAERFAERKNVETPQPPESLAPPPVPRRSRPPQPTIASQAAAPVQRGAESDDRRAVIVPPEFTNARPPIYPDEAVAQRWRGVVLLTLTVSERGQVVEVKVAKSSGYPGLDAAAVRAVRTWSGRPATRNGKPFRSQWNKPIRFE